MSDTAEASGSGGRSRQPQQSAEPNSRLPEAASVNRRWWEDSGALGALLRPRRSQVEAPVVRLPHLSQAPPPPPPPGPWAAKAAVPPPSSPPGWTSRAGATPQQTDLLVLSERARIQHLEQELEMLREESAALQDLLEDLPEIYERKFRQRLQGILEQRQLLLADNHRLREQLHALLPLAAEAGTRRNPALPAATASAEPGAEAAETPPMHSLMQRLRRFGSGLGPGKWSFNSRTAPGQADHELSAPPDDGPPRAA